MTTPISSRLRRPGEEKEGPLGAYEGYEVTAMDKPLARFWLMALARRDVAACFKPEFGR
jgi:hypothetical protein